MEGILLVIAIVFGVPFAIGYAVGKDRGSRSGSNDEQRLQGQREVRDYLIDFISKQPKQISKSLLLKEMGVASPSKTVAEEVKQQKTIQAVEKDASWSPFDDGEDEDDSKTTETVSKRTVVSHEKSKEQRDLQNINTILYVASFLLVAAAVLFIGAAVDNSLKFIGAWVVTIGFYSSGMILHSASKRLRPAAVAFIGTGLALLPFAGLATNIFVLHDPVNSWFITSILGLVLYLFATLKLQSQVLAYLTLGFVFSMTTSSVAVLQMGFVWYFVLIILVASLLNIIAYFKPKLLPTVFLKPIDDSGQLAVPLAVFGSWITVSQVPLWQNAVVLAIASLHYGVAALAPTNPSYRKVYVFLCRLAASISAVLFVYDLSHKDAVNTGIAVTVVATIQILISAILAKKRNNQDEQIWLWGGIVVQLLAISLWSLSDSRAELTTMSLVISCITGLSLAIWLQQARFALVTVFVGAALPIQIGKDLMHPPLGYETVVGIYIGLSIGMMILRKLWSVNGEKKEVVIAGYGLYLIIAGTLSLGLSHEWMAAYFGIIALLITAISYIEKSGSLQVVANAVFLVAVYAFVSIFEHDIARRLLMTSWIAAAIFYALRIFFPTQKDQTRAQIMGVYAVILLMGAGLLYVFNETYAVAAASTLIVASALITIEGWVYKQHEYYEIAILTTTLALQRILAVNTTGIETLLYANWWAIIFYGLAWLRRQRKDKSATQLWVGLSLAVLLFTAFFYISPEHTALNASLTLLAAAAILMVEGVATKIHGYYEASAIVATVALQRMFSLTGDYDLLVYTHWWAFILAVLAGARYVIKDKQSALQWLVAALCLFSIPTGLAALGDPNKYQLLFLIEHVILLVIGGMLNYRLVVLWGSSGIALAVLYWLKDQTYILLGLLGIGLIGLAMWRLLKKK